MYIDWMTSLCIILKVLEAKSSFIAHWIYLPPTVLQKRNWNSKTGRHHKLLIHKPDHFPLCYHMEFFASWHLVHRQSSKPISRSPVYGLDSLAIICPWDRRRAWQEMPAGRAQHSRVRGLILSDFAELACLFSVVSAPIWFDLQEPRGCFTICLLVRNCPFCSSNRVLDSGVALGQPTEELLLGLQTAEGKETLLSPRAKDDKWLAHICSSKCDPNTSAILLQFFSYKHFIMHQTFS